jgi:UDP-3-O-[3-hydroxymyristoyl] glucosamine N-acyltransferase
VTDGTTRISGGGGGSRSLTAAAIAEVVGGILRGDGSAVVSAVAPLDRARRHHVTFLASARYGSLFAESEAGVALVSPELEDAPGKVLARIIVPAPHDAMLKLLASLYPAPARESGVHPTAVIGRGAQLGEGIWVGPHAVIGAGVAIGDRSRIEATAVVGDGVAIGADCHVYPGVCLYAGTSIGDRVRLHAGVRLGSDGFGYVFRGGQHEKIPHVGRCIVESDVEIGANSTVDRGSIDDTVIGAGTKIDNLVHIGHNVRVGRLCLIMAQVGIAGSARVEDGCIIAGQAGIAGHHTIGRGARLAAQAGAFGDIPAGESWSGYPARPHREALRAQAAMFKLPSLIRGLERLLAADEKKSERESR